MIDRYTTSKTASILLGLNLPRLDQSRFTVMPSPAAETHFSALVSLLFQRQFVFYLIFLSCVLYYIKLLPGICQFIVTLAIVLLFAFTFAICNKNITYLLTYPPCTWIVNGDIEGRVMRYRDGHTISRRWWSIVSQCCMAGVGLIRAQPVAARSLRISNISAASRALLSRTLLTIDVINVFLRFLFRSRFHVF